VRVTTAFNEILALSGASAVSVALTPDGIVLGLRRRCRRLVESLWVLHPWRVRPLHAAMAASGTGSYQSGIWRPRCAGFPVDDVAARRALGRSLGGPAGGPLP
jgi:hypothetical protein